MPDEPFLLVSLEEAKAKKLASVLQNKTCTKLLNHLSRHKEATESKLAQQLKLPLSTVHYNLQQLVTAGLVVADEYHYSAKGREVLHYRLANKYIIIAPQAEQEGFLQRLKKILPAFSVVVGVAAALQLLGWWVTRSASSAAAVATVAAPPALKAEALDAAARAAPLAATAPGVEPVATTTATHTLLTTLTSTPVLLAFLVGGIVALLLTPLLNRRKR